MNYVYSAPMYTRLANGERLLLKVQIYRNSSLNVAWISATLQDLSNQDSSQEELTRALAMAFGCKVVTKGRYGAMIITIESNPN